MSRGTLVAGLHLAAVVTVFLCAGSASAQSKAREPAGHILWAFGQVERIGSDGAAKPLAKGDPVFEGDVVRTAPGSSAQLIMSDEALVALRAESSLKLDRYRYHGVEDGTEAALLQLLKGGIRSITGAIGRTNKESYQLRNDGHVIGIRGTDHETYATESGTFNRVTLGGTYLQSAGGRVDLAPGEVGFVAALPGSAPSRLERTPAFMHIAALATANPGMQPGKEDAPGAQLPFEADRAAAPAAPAASIGGPAMRGAPVAGAMGGAGASVSAPSAAPALGVPAVTPVLPSRAVGPANGANGRGAVSPAHGRAAGAPAR